METKRSYTAPQGTVIKEVKLSDDKKTLITIFEEEKYVPKVGDYFEASSGIVAHCDMVESKSPKCVTDYMSDGKLNKENFHFNVVCMHYNNTFIELSKKEFQSKFNAIGYEYNFETHTADKMRWKPKYGEHYLLVNPAIEIVESYNSDSNSDKLVIESGNCFKVTDRESAEKFLNYIKQYKP